MHNPENHHEKNIVQVFIEKVLFLEDEIEIGLKFGGGWNAQPQRR
ncbi:hypothetical protein [Paenibacillus tianmuensis]|nr:hypothetical protein [Paenibacillus tianmuensis]